MALWDARTGESPLPSPPTVTPPSWADGPTTAKPVRLGCSAGVAVHGRSKARSSSAPVLWEAQTRGGPLLSRPTATLLSWVGLATICGIHRCPSGLAPPGRHGYSPEMAVVGRRKVI